MTSPEATARPRETVEIRHLQGLDECAEVVELFCKVWAAKTAEDLVNISLLRSWAMSGNYVVGAYRRGVLAGAAVAFRGERHLHSHIVGVDPTRQSQQIGYQLKEHQRRWALDQGFPAIRWTFDPLIRRNAHFNLAKLGVQVLAYHANLYGHLNDGINDGDESDRLLVEWSIAPPESGETGRERARHEIDGITPFNSYDDAAWEAAGPAVTSASADGNILLVATPQAIEELRLVDANRAQYWRSKVRDAFRTALNDGFTVIGFTPGGLYVLHRRSSADVANG